MTKNGCGVAGKDLVQEVTAEVRRALWAIGGWRPPTFLSVFVYMFFGQLDSAHTE